MMRLKLLLFGVVVFAGTGSLRAQWVQVTSLGSIQCFATNGSNLFEVVEIDGIVLSTDDGASWAAHLNTAGLINIQAIAVGGTNLFAGTYGGGVFLSTNNGTSWKAVNSGLANTNVVSLAVSGTNLFAGTDGDGVVLSTNDGTSWTTVNTGFTDGQVNALAVSGTDLFAATNADYGGGGIFLSTNNGTSWVRTGPSAFRSLAASGTYLFAGSWGDGVSISTNDGKSWVSTGLTNDVHSVAVDGTNLLAGTWGTGLWRRPLSDFAISAVTSLPTSTESGFQSYPNPFSQSTQIIFTPQASGYAEVSIFNQLGEAAAHLFSGELDAGEHSWMWGKPTGLPGGVYECIVRMNGRVETLPIVVTP